MSIFDLWGEPLDATLKFRLCQKCRSPNLAPNLLVSESLSREIGRKGLKSPYFHGRLSTGGLVSLKDRRNGGVLFVALACPEGQVAQCRGDHFGSLDQTVAALTPLANDYARGVLTRVELKKELERIKEEKEKEVGITTKEEKKIVKQEKAEKDKTGKQPPDSSAAMPIKKEVNKKRTRDDEKMFDDEDTLPWGLDEDVEMLFTSTRTATDVSERE